MLTLYCYSGIIRYINRKEGKNYGYYDIGQDNQRMENQKQARIRHFRLCSCFVRDIRYHRASRHYLMFLAV